jgi:hypothetical protein
MISCERSIDLPEARFYSVSEMANPPPKPQLGSDLSGLWGLIARKLGIDAWGQVLILVLVLLFGAGGRFIWSFNNRLTTIEANVDKLPSSIGSQFDVKLANLNTDLKAGLANLKTDLIQEFFSRAQKASKAGNFDDAVAELRAASILTEGAANRRTPVLPGFFFVAIQELNNLSAMVRGPSVLSGPLNKARVALAEYRSSLEPVPHLPASHQLSSSSDLAHALGFGSILRWDGPPGEDMIEQRAPSLIEPPPSISDLALINGQQTLDNWRWRNVLFVNMHIVYRGGPVGLMNVRFIHCTFATTPDPPGSVVTDYAALKQSFAESPS